MRSTDAMTANILPIRRHGLREGDAVRSMVGGPIMLVAIADPMIMTEVECIWTERRRLKTRKFNPDMLILLARP